MKGPSVCPVAVDVAVAGSGSCRCREMQHKSGRGVVKNPWVLGCGAACRTTLDSAPHPSFFFSASSSAFFLASRRASARRVRSYALANFLARSG